MYKIVPTLRFAHALGPQSTRIMYTPEKERGPVNLSQVAISRCSCWEGGGGGKVTNSSGGGRQSEVVWWALTPTLSKLGRKYHHNWMYSKKWPSPVYVLCGTMWYTLHQLGWSFPENAPALSISKPTKCGLCSVARHVRARVAFLFHPHLC